ncbi:hypothetical protein BHE74_00026991, partial [Ensete ventricosum]
YARRRLQLSSGRAALEVDAAMEDDAETAAPSSSSKRLALKNSIQTNFGDDYIFQIAAKYHPHPP